MGLSFRRPHPLDICVVQCVSSCWHAFRKTIRLQTHTGWSAGGNISDSRDNGCLQGHPHSKRTMIWFVVLGLDQNQLPCWSNISALAIIAWGWAALSTLSFISILSHTKPNPCPVWDFFISKNPHSVQKLGKESRCL